MLSLASLCDGALARTEIISESWVRTSIAEHSHVDNTAMVTSVAALVNVETPAGPSTWMYQLSGNGGQKIYLVPQSTSSLSHRRRLQRGIDSANTIMAKIILPH